MSDSVLMLIINILLKLRPLGTAYLVIGSNIVFAERLKAETLNPLSYTNQTVTPLRGGHKTLTLKELSL